MKMRSYKNSVFIRNRTIRYYLSKVQNTIYLKLLLLLIVAAKASLSYAEPIPEGVAAKHTSLADASALISEDLQKTITTKIEKEQYNKDLVKNSVDEYASFNADLLYLNDETKRILNNKIRPIKSRIKRTLALHKLLFSREQMNIYYSSEATYTAQQVFDKGRGNCVGLAALFVAGARYLGLRAQFQNVEVEPAWEKSDKYYILPSHVNAVVRFPGKSLHVEFMDALYQTEVNIKKTRKITDAKAIAQYHNNIAMEYAGIGDYKKAERHMDISLSHLDDLDYIWSNYGVIKKLSGDFPSAEKMYRKALDINPKNLSALKNLYVLLNKMNKAYEAQKIASKVERYSLRNPYYLARISEADLYEGRYHYALSNIRKAIRIDKKIPTFYHIEARILIAMGNLKKAGDSLLLAKSYSRKESDIARYAYKFSTLSDSLQAKNIN